MLLALPGVLDRRVTWASLALPDPSDIPVCMQDFKNLLDEVVTTTGLPVMCTILHNANYVLRASRSLCSWGSSDVVLETRVLVSRRLKGKNESLGLDLRS